MLLLLLAACGVKREVSLTVDQPEVVSEQSEAVSETLVTENKAELVEPVEVTENTTPIEPADTIATSDSTIHINYVCGIPFVIDDSVPMLLPPIDKNPVGYVSSDKYARREKEIRINRYIDEIFACGKINPVDSLLWLNKLINDIPSFLNCASIEVSHHYTYKVTLWSIESSTCIYMIYVIQLPDWFCIADNTPRYQRIMSYFVDDEGNLLGKLFAEQPIEWINHIEYRPNYLRVITFDNIYSMLRKKARYTGLIMLNYTKYDKTLECYVE